MEASTITERSIRAPKIVLSETEERAYNLAAAMLDVADGKKRSGLAWEISDELSSALPPGAIYRGGLLVPHSLRTSLQGTRAGLDTSTATKGSELKFTEPGPFIEALRKKAVVLRLGATELEGLRGDVKFPRQTAPGSALWVPQNPASATPTAPSATPVGAGGTFAAGTYYWKITTIYAGFESSSSAEVSATIVLNGSATIAWTPDPRATGHRVYRGTAAGGENAYQVAGAGGTFTDTGAAGTAATPPTTADVADSNFTLDQASLTPKSLQSSTSYSRQLLTQALSSTGIDRLVRSDLAQDHAVAIDAAALAGSGTAGNPTGITNTAGVGLVAGGANGLQPTWANITGLELAVSNANADTDPAGMAYCMSPTIRNTLRNKDRAGTSTGWFVMSDGQAINGYPVGVSNNIPQTLTKGTSVGVCHAVIFGLWRELLVGLWGGLEIVSDPYRLKKQGMIELTTYELADITVRHAVSFGCMLDALA